MKLIKEETGDININIIDDKYMTPLTYASRINDTKLFKYLYNLDEINIDDI